MASKLDLEALDAAVIFKMNGKHELHLPKMDENAEVGTHCELAAAMLVVAVHPDFADLKQLILKRFAEIDTKDEVH